MIRTIQGDSEIRDIDQLIDLIEKQMRFIGANSSSEQIRKAINNISKNNRALFWVKVSEAGDFCGFAFGNIGSGLETGADYLWINELYVVPECRKKNIASEIINYIENWAKQNNIKYIALIADQDNQKALKFYEKAGYEFSSLMWVDKTL